MTSYKICKILFASKLNLKKAFQSWFHLVNCLITKYTLSKIK